MDLKSGYPFWAIKNGLMHAFPRLQSAQSCEVAIIGGGITAALIAHELAKHGHDLIVVEKRDIGWGSTSASTALLQYEIDTPMFALARRFGMHDAVLAYRSCADAIGMLREVAAEIRNVDFMSMRSLYYASHARDVATMQMELALRRKYGFKADWLDGKDLRADFGIRADGAISTSLAAGVDPYRLTNRILARLSRQGSRVYDRTRVTGVRRDKNALTLDTDHGTVHARCVVVAAGYASQHWLKAKVAVNRSSYAFVTDPIPKASLGRMRRMMAWESAHPYLYLRATGDGRILIGGEDDAIDIPARRDARVKTKAKALMRKASRILPGVELKPTFSWAGTFAETEDGLPFFGNHPQHNPRIHFAMAYGGNGITYSMLGAKIIRFAIEGRTHPLSELFSFRRLSR